MHQRLMVIAIGLLGACSTSHRSPAALEPGGGGLTLGRKYALGETFLYKLTTVSGVVGQEPKTTVAISNHTVEREGEASVERIKWSVLRDETSERDDSATAQALQVVTFSLDPRWEVDFSPPAEPKMVGAVSDLFTFYVSASRLAGADRLAQVGDRYVVPEELVGDWAQASDTRIGRDCTRLIMTLTELTESVATIQANYEVPTRSCFDPSFPWMAESIDGERPNNFEQVKRNGEMWAAVWGHESFVVEVQVDRRSGKILSGTMDNKLSWHVKACMDDALMKCGDAPPMEFRRDLKLELLP